MALVQLIDNLKILSINTPQVNMSSFGDISLYDNKAKIKYPYVNLDVVTSSIVNYSKKYKIRFYVVDRNDPYIAYNKTELILDEILKNSLLDIAQYTVNYFTLDFQDLVNGVYADIDIEEQLLTNCSVPDITGETGYILQENGDLIKIEL